MQLDALQSTNSTETAAWVPVTSSPNSVSKKNPLDVTVLGTTDSGRNVTPAYTAEGHAEVAIHSPRLPFGSVHTERLEPVLQVDAVYGLNPKLVTSTIGVSFGTAASTGVATASNNMFSCSTGTAAFSFATVQSRRRLRYRPGQGVVGRFAGLFPTSASASIVVAGFGTSESGYYFGYNGTSFGILHSNGGTRELQTLTITTASTATNNYVITQPNGVNVTVSGATSGAAPRTAYEISQGTYSGWKAGAIGNTVVFLADSVGNQTSTFTLAQPGAVAPAAGTCVETRAGVAGTDVWIPQSTWNGDVLDGSNSTANASGATLDPSKGNVYEMGIQYLGFGSVEFRIEVNFPGRNNPDFITVHTIQNPNALTQPHVKQPSFPFTMAAYSAGSTTDVSVQVGSFAGFNEGEKKLIGPRMSYYRETNGYVGSAILPTYYPLFTIRNGLTFANRANQSVVHLKSISCSHDDATPVAFVLLRNAVLSGPVNFTQFATTSTTYWDQGATTCTASGNDQTEFALNLGQSAGGSFDLDDEITLQPGETLTLAARAVTGTATYVIGSLNTREDQ